jgi:hypothetical protein
MSLRIIIIIILKAVQSHCVDRVVTAGLGGPGIKFGCCIQLLFCCCLLSLLMLLNVWCVTADVAVQ